MTNSSDRTPSPSNDTLTRRTPAPPEGRLIDTPAFQKAVAPYLENQQLRSNMRHATHSIRAKRAKVCAELPNWQALREQGKCIKQKVVENLDHYLTQLERNFIANGVHVHWAKDAREACSIVTKLVQSKGVDEVVKIKSMVTQEIELNEALEAAGIAAWETDLAELIVQLGHDRPSNILVPAIHRNRDEVREIFLREMGRYGKAAPANLSNDPADLAAAARAHLREKFLRAKVAISGANFCVADSGSLVIVESEGNGRMCLTLPETLITVTGIEKIVPNVRDLEVMLQLLPRSSTGERMNPYTSIWSGPSANGDGPQDQHVVLVDNGRRRVLADEQGREALRCIRCAACMHQCPVYERVGGHPYGSVYPGPIGSILTPQLRGFNSEIDKSLPYASTLCGACAEVCPVMIPIPDILVHLRHRVVEEKKRGHFGLEQFVMRIGGWFFAKGSRFGRLEALAAIAGGLFSRSYIKRLPWLGKRWTSARDLRLPPKVGFRKWWKRNEQQGIAERQAAVGCAKNVLSQAGEQSAAAQTAKHGVASPTADHGVASQAASQRDETTVWQYGQASAIADPQALFEERVCDYKATVKRVKNGEEIAMAVAEFLATANAESCVVPPELDEAWLVCAKNSGIEILKDEPHLSKETLDHTSAVITAAAVALAETGTIALDHSSDQGRRTISLLPDTHICVIRAEQIVTDVPGAVARLEVSIRNRQPITWISGPSATSDIELVRVEGVHGPRNLFVIVVDD